MPRWQQLLQPVHLLFHLPVRARSQPRGSVRKALESQIAPFCQRGMVAPSGTPAPTFPVVPVSGRLVYPLSFASGRACHPQRNANPIPAALHAPASSALSRFVSAPLPCFAYLFARCPGQEPRCPSQCPRHVSYAMLLQPRGSTTFNLLILLILSPRSPH